MISIYIYITFDYFINFQKRKDFFLWIVVFSSFIYVLQICCILVLVVSILNIPMFISSLYLLSFCEPLLKKYQLIDWIHNRRGVYRDQTTAEWYYSRKIIFLIEYFFSHEWCRKIHKSVTCKKIRKSSSCRR